MALAANTTCTATAQIVPQPDMTNPRLQTVNYVAGESIQLLIMPGASLTLVFPGGETVTRVAADTGAGYEVRVSPDRDSLLVLAGSAAPPSVMQVQTDRRSYRFNMETGTGLMAAYLVQIRDPAALGAPTELAPFPAQPSRFTAHPQTWSYLIKGDREVRPEAISDDGVQTRIQYGEEQALPAVFAIGPTGDEQLVNGYMRGEVFVIDRTWQELIFRIDKKKATARRAEQPDSVEPEGG